MVASALNRRLVEKFIQMAELIRPCQSQLRDVERLRVQPLTENCEFGIYRELKSEALLSPSAVR